MNQLKNEFDLNEAIKSEISKSLYWFDKIALGYDKMELHAHWQLCEFIEGRYSDNKERSGNRFKLVLMPRNSFKTSVVTVGYPIKKIVENPNIRILIANATFDNAKKFLSEIKGHFEKNEILRALYGDFVSKDSWTKEEITISQRTKNLKEPTISTAGIGVGTTGMHYDLIILDDLVNEKNITSRDMMEQVINYYKEAITQLDPNGVAVVIGTIWHFADLYNHVIEKEKHRFDVFRRAAYFDDGKLLFPEILSEQFLQEQRMSLGTARFSCQYLNEAIDSEDAVFKREWFRYYSINNEGVFKPDELDENESKRDYYKSHSMYWYMTIDPAVSEDKGADYTGIVICAVDPDDRKYVVLAEQYKLNPHDLVEKIIELIKTYPIKEIGIETAASQITLKFSLYKRMKEEQRMIMITELPSVWTKSKYQRVLSLQPVFEFKEIYLKQGMFKLEEQLLGVGSEGFKTRHDDIIDAFANQTRLWRKPPKNIMVSPPEGSFMWWRDKMLYDKKDKATYENVPGNNFALRSKEYYG